MKVVEINKLIRKHIEQALPDYSVHKDFIYKLENDFFIKGYYFESRGNDDLDLAVWYFVQPLFVKKDFIVLTLGARLSYKKKVGLLKTKELDWWDARKEHLDESFQSILEVIKLKGEKKLEQIKTSEEFYNKFYGERKDNVRIYEAIAYSTILFGKEDVQDKAIKGLIDFCNKQIESESDEIEMQIKEDATLLLEAVTTINRLEVLKTWANETIGHLKLPHIKPFS